MTAIDGLIEEAGELEKYSRKSLMPAISEIASVEATIQALISTALDLQDQLFNIIIFRIEAPLPVGEEKEETSTEKDGAPSIQDYIINIGPVNIYSLAEAVRDTLETFETQTSEIAEIFSPYAVLEKTLPIEPGFIKTPTSSKESVTENLNADLRKSALAINELKTIYDSFSEVTIEKNRMISEKEGINRFSNLFKVETEGIQRNGITDVRQFSDKANYFSEIIRDASNSLYSRILEIHEITDISSLNKSLTVDSVPIEVIKDIKNAYSSEKTFKSSNIVSDFSETAEMMSTAFNKSISEVNEITDISSLSKISTRVSHPSKTRTDAQKTTIHTDQNIFEVPAFRPKISLEDATINVSRLSNAISKKSHEKESILISKEFISSPAAKYTTSSQSISEPSVYVSNAFETISTCIDIASEVDRRASEMTREGIIDANKILWQSHLLNMIFSDGGSAAFNLDRFPTYEGSGVIAGAQMMHIALDMASIGAFERAGSSVINNTSLVLSRGADFRTASLAKMPYAVENVLHILSGSQKDTVESSRSSNNTVNLQNTFNIVVNVNNDGKETELREIGRKIGQILSDEIRRYGGIR